MNRRALPQNLIYYGHSVAPELDVSDSAAFRNVRARCAADNRPVLGTNSGQGSEDCVNLHFTLYSLHFVCGQTTKNGKLELRNNFESIISEQKTNMGGVTPIIIIS
jgi:hypothetical protein